MDGKEYYLTVLHKDREDCAVPTPTGLQGYLTYEKMHPPKTLP